MKFHINQIHLWLKDDLPKRVLNFLPNKVNVITGESGTGKTSIITIIDYCLLGSESRLVEEVINENVIWYGLKFTINDKAYFIARKRMDNQKPSDEVFFSSTGMIPSVPTSSITIAELKKIIEQEFSIDSNLVIPYGGKKIQAGSKVSFRYFLLFNTQSTSIILNPNVFFDYDLYDAEKYREALDRIFDLSIGTDTVDNVLIKEKLSQIEKQIIKLEKKKVLTDKEVKDFSNRILELVKQAREYDLIENRLLTPEDALQRLETLIHDFKEDKITTDLTGLDNLYKDKRIIARKIRNLRSFENEYERYKESIKNDIDSLQPIEYLSSNFQELIPIPEIKSFMEGLNEELSRIKGSLEKKKPFSTNVTKEIEEKEKELNEVNLKIDQFPIQTKDFESSIAKFIFIGELRAKLAFYKREWENEDYDKSILELYSEQEELSRKLSDNDERRNLLIQLLQERIQKYVDNSNAIDNYKTFKVYLNYKKKILQLREPNASNPSNIGSSSNHMFLHLFMFLGLHEHFISEKIPFVPSFLLIDQLSQPYYDEARKSGLEEIIDGGDKLKLTEAFKLLNDFIGLVRDELKSEFQFILFEHAQKEFWEDNDMKNFHLVEEFRNGNALILGKAN
jgi:hypothetical protein